MIYQVFLRHTDGSGYRATPLLFPDCVAVGKTRDEALANLRSLLDARLAEGEIVMLEVGEPEHPWLRGAGMFGEDPAFDDFLAEVEAYRREVDAAETDRADLSP
jgi:predicted RNase H-like HicB family nuclease